MKEPVFAHTVRSTKTEQTQTNLLKISDLETTLLTPSFGNQLFAYHLVLKHPHTNMILSSFCFPKVTKSRKECHKTFANWFINKNLMPKNDLDLVFYMCKGGKNKILN